MMADYLLDTNIILRLVNSDDVQHELVLRAVEALIVRGDNPAVTPQVLIEFWSATTRPSDVNGYGWDPTRVAQEIVALSARFRLLPDDPTIYSKWIELVTNIGVRGKQVHDTRLVAVMLVHGVRHLLTFNVKDFQRFGQIEAVHPTTVVVA
jgi:predicted nucleic acid-binding protein